MSLASLAIRRIVHPLHLAHNGHYAQERYLREYERTQYLPFEEVQRLQLRRLQKRLRHAYLHCRYYREQWDQAGLHPDDIQRLDDLASFPILTKADIQRDRDAMIADDMPASSMRLDHTGGSTGAPISYYQSWDVHCSRMAATRRHDRWAGYQLGDRSAWVWGAPRDLPPDTFKSRLRRKLIDRTLYLDTAHFTAGRMEAFSARLREHRPKVIFAYARALAHLAGHLREAGLEVYRPASIITSAEMLSDDDRAVIQQVFQCPVFNRYGCREVGVIASECQEHAGLHTMAEGLYIEVVVGDRPARPGELGKILITDLLNFAMPLIRYEIGDMGCWDPAPCPCGRGLPRLKGVAGRVTDFVVGPDGRLVSGVFLATYVVAKRPTLGQVQIWQTAPGTLTYKIAPRDGAPTSSADLDFLRTSTAKYVGAGTETRFEFVDELKPEPSGKFIFCRSTVDPALVAQ
ncbi:MAG: phenylacetate--CoA ligase family protein [Pirellulales bacterium]|nr:phenylacetate--CoA ligase family protein [Pirellulales bacterium]